MSKQQERCTPIYYSVKEEILCAIVHGLGALFGIYALIQMVVDSATRGNAWAVVAAAIYGASLIILYTISTLSHALTARAAKKVFRILDHATIFLLIAGTYTPVTLITLQGGWGWTIFGIQWGLAAIGIVMGSLWLNRFKKISSFLYLLMGWAIIIAAYPMLQKMAPAGLIYMLGGGIFYSVGILLYRSKSPYTHFLMHLFTLIGSLLQYLSIIQYVLPMTF